MDANVCYFALHKLHMLPSQFFALPREERAFVYAAIFVKGERDKKLADELKNKTNK